MSFEFPEKPYKSNYEVILGDTFANLKNFGNGKFDLIITSPPYNVGKEYNVKCQI